MVSLSIWPRVIGDCASMVPIGSWVRLVHGSWVFFFFFPWIMADLVVGRGWFGWFGSWVFFGCGLWFVGFFLFGYGWWLQIEKWWKRKVVGLWLVGQWWRWFCWSKMTQTKRQHRWSFDQSLIQTKPRFKLKKLWRFGHGSLLNYLGFFFCVCFPRKFLGLGLLEISLFFFFLSLWVWFVVEFSLRESICYVILNPTFKNLKKIYFIDILSFK